MKTPRELLMKRHEAAVPELNHIRNEVLKTELCAAATAGGPWPLGWFVVLGRELIWPARRIWAGFAAVWVVIFVINLTNLDPREMATDTTAPPSTEVLLAREQQRRLLTELIQSMSPEPAEPAEPPRRSPQPRSERQLVWVIG